MEIYSPVVNWLSVNIIFALSVIYDLDTRSIDFVLSFPHAKVDVDVFIELLWANSGLGKLTHTYSLELITLCYVMLMIVLKEIFQDFR